MHAFFIPTLDLQKPTAAYLKPILYLKEQIKQKSCRSHKEHVCDLNQTVFIKGIMLKSRCLQNHSFTKYAPRNISAHDGRVKHSETTNRMKMSRILQPYQEHAPIRCQSTRGEENVTYFHRLLLRVSGCPGLPLTPGSSSASSPYPFCTFAAGL